jgi:hypothetical protein
MSYITSQEMKCILHWFASWSGYQRERFLQDLVAKAVPGKLQPLLDGLEQLSISEANHHLVFLSASYVFGISGLEARLNRSSMNSSGSWRSVSQTS